MPDAFFADPRLARLYDPLEEGRPDLEAYVAMAAEFGARSIIDMGCGTGALSCRLAECGYGVVGIDPAVASLDIARSKPAAERVTWICADAETAPPLVADLVVMTGNVAQVFVTDDSWSGATRWASGALADGGRFVFETRVPSRQAWLEWSPEQSLTRRTIDGVGELEAWAEVVEVAGPLVSFRWTFRFRDSGEVLTSDSTLRFREREEIEASLEAVGLRVVEVREAPDRPGAEWVFVAAASMHH